MILHGNSIGVKRNSRSRCGRFRLSMIGAVLLALLTVESGCQGAGGKRARDAQAARDTDVYRVVCFYPPNTWKSFDAEGDLNPEGFSFVMYLISRKTNKGVFADGTFHVEMYQRGGVDPEGRRPRTLIFETSASMDQLPHRAPTMLGQGYQPSVFWGDLDIYGADIEILIKYESPSGRVVPSETVNLKVPERKV